MTSLQKGYTEDEAITILKNIACKHLGVLHAVENWKINLTDLHYLSLEERDSDLAKE